MPCIKNLHKKLYTEEGYLKEVNTKTKEHRSFKTQENQPNQISLRN